MKKFPIFVGGCPRSGTTMLASLLGGHKRILCVPEAPFKIQLLGLSDIKNTSSKKQVIDKIFKNKKLKIWNVDHENLDIEKFYKIRNTKQFCDLLFDYYNTCLVSVISIGPDNFVISKFLMTTSIVFLSFSNSSKERSSVYCSIKFIDSRICFKCAL